MKDLEGFLHDLRAPLARAKTLAHLAQDAEGEELRETLRDLLVALEKLDEKISAGASS